MEDALGSHKEYTCFADLAAAHREGIAFAVETRARSLNVLVIAPHGGRIELHTDAIAREIASDDLSLHIFESKVPCSQANLHITSHKYDHPDALALAQRCRIGVGIHGRAQNASDDEEIWMGGLNESVATSVLARLKHAGFGVRIGGHQFPALNPNNICNRPTENGIQLEMPLQLRKRLQNDHAIMAKFTHAIRTGLGI